MARYPQPEINIEKEINTLNYKFKQETRNIRGSSLKELQVDYAYMIQDITFAPKYVLEKLINKTYTFISNINELKSV